MDRYRRTRGERCSQDVAAMRLLALLLGVESPDEQLRAPVQDDYEQRAQAALNAMQGLVLTPVEQPIRRAAGQAISAADA